MSEHILTVALDPGDPSRSGRHQTVLASLPARFRITTTADADVVLVSGDQPGWRRRALDAIAAPVRAVMLSGSSAMSAAELGAVAAAAATAGVLAAADLAYTPVRSWAEARPALAADLPSSAVLDCVVTAPVPASGQSAVTALRSVLAEQLALVGPVIGDALSLVPVHLSDHEYVLAGSPDGLAVTLSGALSVAGPGLELTLAGGQRRWHVRFTDRALAAPVAISAWDTEGEHAWPPRYESGHRETWLRLHDALRGEPEGCHTAGQLAGYLASAQAALSQVLA